MFNLEKFTDPTSWFCINGNGYPVSPSPLKIRESNNSPKSSSNYKHSTPVPSTSHPTARCTLHPGFIYFLVTCVVLFPTGWLLNQLLTHKKVVELLKNRVYLKNGIVAVWFVALVCSTLQTARYTNCFISFQFTQ